MQSLSYAVTVAALVALVAPPAAAQVGKGLSGHHYNLNIIGVPQGKSPDMKGNSHRHTLFVPLQNGEVDRKVKIYFVPGPDFGVLDGNATDDNEATIQVPYEYCEDYEAGCEDLLSYDVYAVGLGKPYGGAIITAECTYSVDAVDGSGPVECEDTLLMGSFYISRTKGKPRPKNISDVFRATGCLDANGSGYCDSGDLEFRNLWIFNIAELYEYLWDYENYGLKLMQVRFYDTTSGYMGIKP